MQRSATGGGGGGEGGGGNILFVLLPTPAGIIAVSLLAYCLWRRKRLHERARSAGDAISMTIFLQRMRSAYKEAKSGTPNSSNQGTASIKSGSADSSAAAQALRMVRAPEIPESEITLGRMLGRGGSGTVQAGTWLGMAVAVKKLDERTSGDQQQRLNLERMPHRA